MKGTAGKKAKELTKQKQNLNQYYNLPNPSNIINSKQFPKPQLHVANYDIQQLRDRVEEKEQEMKKLEVVSDVDAYRFSETQQVNDQNIDLMLKETDQIWESLSKNEKISAQALDSMQPRVFEQDSYIINSQINSQISDDKQLIQQKVLYDNIRAYSQSSHKQLQKQKEQVKPQLKLFPVNNLITKSERQRTLILNMQIELGEKNQELKIYENDDFLQVARDFVKQHQLKEEAIDVLAQNIQDNVNAIYQLESQKVQSDTFKDNFKVHPNSCKNQVFSKLFLDSQMRQKKQQLNIQQSQQKSRQQLSQRKSSKENVGDQLYQKGLANMKLKSKMHEQYQQNKQQLDKQCTFKPQISETSKKIQQNKDSQYLYQSHIKKSHILSEEYKIFNNNKEIQKKLQFQQSQNTLTFKPEINQISKQIIKAKEAYQPKKDIFNNLFNSKLRVQKNHLREELKECTFQPNLQIHPQKKMQIILLEEDRFSSKYLKADDELEEQVNRCQLIRIKK